MLESAKHSKILLLLQQNSEAKCDLPGDYQNYQ